MKKIIKIAVFVMVFVIGIARVNAAPFKIGETEYASLNEAVAAAPSDGTETLIEMTEDVTLAPGVQVTTGKNLVIDFGGHTFETWEPMVGSNGTETQSFQLLKGSQVYMKNGTLVGSTHPLSKMFIQNYADLTLDNITINATTNTYDYFYGLSSNYGKVLIKGNTSIFVNKDTHARAFDMCWAPIVGNASYNGGTQMTIDTTGTISGIIELDVWGSYTDVNGIKSTLYIKNINFDGKWEIDSRLRNQLTIEGGNYKKTNTIDLNDYVVDNYIPYEYNDSYDVLPATSLTINEEEIYILQGETYNLDIVIPSGYEKYASITVDDTDVASISNGVITALAKGNTSLVVSFGRSGANLPIVVYEITTPDPSNSDDVEADNAVEKIAADLIGSILGGEDVEGIDASTKANVINAILNDKTIVTEVEIDEIDEADIAEEVVEQIKDTIKETNGEIVGFLNIDVELLAGTDELGKITKLPNPITITVDVDDKLGNIPEGTSRKFYIVRMHDGEEPELIEATYRDGKLSFETDRFSTYAYGYSDTAITNPKTGDSVGTYFALLVISIVGLTLCFITKKRRA
jgi:hypothetical protein